MPLAPISEIKAQLGIEPNGRVQQFFTNACAEHMEKYVPCEYGNLRDADIGNDYVRYKGPYAYYQYMGVRKDGTHKVTKYTTPGTGPYWDKQMVSAELYEVVKETQGFLEEK